MTAIATVIKFDERQLAERLGEAEALLDSVDGEISLDFSAVRQIDASELRALKHFCDVTQDQGVTLSLHGVEAGVYRVLKLAKLTSRLSVAS